MSPRRTREPPDLDAIRKEVAEWFALKRQDAIVGEKLEELRRRLQALIQKYGEVEPEHGHIILDLGEPVGDDNILQLRNQKRDSTSMNVNTVEEILRGKGLWEEMTELIRVPDQGRINAAFFDKKITQDELDQMFPTKTNWSLYALDDMGKPVRT